jgi:2-polyprenyl-3-methyl-5-hydroxy-6-metoxy-1,4-benzoquinol methylase
LFGVSDAASQTTREIIYGFDAESPLSPTPMDDRVEAIDLTPQYFETAERSNKLGGIEHKIAVRQGSVTDLPYEDQSFDLVSCQNVTMNVEGMRMVASRRSMTVRASG